MLNVRDQIAHWRLENTALDTTGNGRNGTVTGAAYVAGRLGRALEFAGGVTTDRVVVAHHASLNPSAGFTAYAWIYPHSSGGGAFGRLFQKSVTPDLSVGYGIYLLADHLGINVTNGGTPTMTTAVTYNSWQHVAVTCTSGGVVLLYLDGKADGGGNTGALAGITTVGDLIIGNRSGWDRSWDGLVDEPGQLNRVLIETDIRRVMLGMSPVA